MLKIIATASSGRLRALRALQKRRNSRARQDSMHRKRMLRALKSGIARYYCDPEEALKLIEKYLVTLNPRIVFEMMQYHLAREIQHNERRLKKGLEKRNRQVSELESELFPKSRGIIRGKATGARFMDNR